MRCGAAPSDDHFSEATRPSEDALYDLPIDEGVPLPSERGVTAADLEPTERDLLQQILRRLGRIEERLEKGGSQVPPSRERRSLEDMFSELIDVLRRMERSSDEISELRKRVGRIEEAVANLRIDRRTSGQSSDPPSVVYGPTPRPQLPEPQGPMPVKAKDASGQSSKPEG
jgi:polyhydroxyalkanoate synthesis regulator phasin